MSKQSKADAVWDGLWVICWAACFAIALSTAIFHPGRQEFIWFGAAFYGLAFLFALFKFHYGQSILGWYWRKRKQAREDPNNWSV